MPDDYEDEFRLLTTDAGLALLAEAERVRAFGPADIARLRRLAATDLVAAAIRLTLARRKAAGKLEQADRMWLEPIAVEQATAGPVARHKAERFAGAIGSGASVVVDLCCGIGGDAIALARAAPVLAVDRDPGMARRVRWNAGVHGVAGNLLAVRADAERFPIPAGARVHLDPDRRARTDSRDRGDRPARAIEDYAPGPAAWEMLRDQVPGGAIKVSPAADFAGAFPIGSGCEVEIISLRGECKEATVWFGDLAATGCRRRATRLPERATWTDRDHADDPRPAQVRPLADLLFDPDPSLIRAGLLDGFARAHGLARVAEGVDYLTGPAAGDSPFLAAFAVLDVAPMDEKHLRRMIARHDVGTLEIKVRGFPVTPEALRARLKPRGDRPATLLVVGGGPGPGHPPARAVLAHRVTGAG